MKPGWRRTARPPPRNDVPIRLSNVARAPDPLGTLPHLNDDSREPGQGRLRRAWRRVLLVPGRRLQASAGRDPRHVRLLRGARSRTPPTRRCAPRTTGHAEVVKIDFDPSKVSLDRVLAYFWHVHDPTQVGGQGNDMGSQYRSIILYAGPDAEGGGGEVARARPRRCCRPDHDRDRAAGEILAGGGISPGLFREASRPGLLHGRDPPEGRQAKADARGREVGGAGPAYRSWP